MGSFFVYEYLYIIIWKLYSFPERLFILIEALTRLDFGLTFS